MTAPELFEEVKNHAGAITAVSAALIILWRYVFKPSATAIKSLKKHSEGIVHFLPLLSSGRQRWPSSSGSGSFLHFIDTLENRVTHNECRTAAILDLSTNPIYECSPCGTCVFANEKLCNLFGLSHAEMMGFGWLEGVEPSDRDRVYSSWEKSIKHRLPYECEYTIRNNRTGERFRAVTRAIPLQFAGDLIGYLGVFSEIEPIEETAEEEA